MKWLCCYLHDNVQLRPSEILATFATAVGVEIRASMRHSYCSNRSGTATALRAKAREKLPPTVMSRAYSYTRPIQI